MPAVTEEGLTALRFQARLLHYRTVLDVLLADFAKERERGDLSEGEIEAIGAHLLAAKGDLSAAISRGDPDEDAD